MSLQNSNAAVIANATNSDLSARKRLNKQFHRTISSTTSEIPLPTSEVNLSPLLTSDNNELESEPQTQENIQPSLQNLGESFNNPLHPLVSIPTDCDPYITDRPSHVSLLAGKYLVFANSPGTTASSRDLQKCINVETREQYSCQVVPRNASGLGLLAAYHRLEEFSDCIGAIHEIILAPKSLYMIFPSNFGSVHSYILGKKRVTEPEAALLFKQIVSAVNYCHGKGIVLRDLKMGKFVFFDKERTVVKLESLEDAVILSDFSDDGLSDKHGCPNYVSPEKADILRSNSKYPGKATDVWGLGVILYTMLVGRYPFNDADHTKLFVKIRKGHFFLPDSLSGSVKCLIRCLLRKEPTGRLSCQEILKHPWLLHKGSPNGQYSTEHWRNVFPSALGHNIGSSSIIPRRNSIIQVGQRKSEHLIDCDDQVVPDIGVTNK